MKHLLAAMVQKLEVTLLWVTSNFCTMAAKRCFINKTSKTSNYNSFITLAAVTRDQILQRKEVEGSFNKERFLLYSIALDST
jgi:hypothetical protein